MICKNCGTELAEGTRFCSTCGNATVAPAPQPAPAPAPAPAPQPAPAPAPIIKEVIPDEYQPMSPWGFLGLQILYSIPIVGFIFLIIFSFNSSNLSRRNFTRSYWCALLVLAIIAVLIIALYVIFVVILGVGIGAMSYGY